MALFYKPIQSTIANKDGEKLWHLSLVKTGVVVETQELAQTIAEKSSLTPGDAHNVVRNLMSVMRKELLNSNSVRLEGLGTFTMKARTRGKGVKTAEEVNPNQITTLRCVFTPEYSRPAAMGTTRVITDGVQFVHINKLTKGIVGGGTDSSGNSPGGDDDGGDDWQDPDA